MSPAKMPLGIIIKVLASLVFVGPQKMAMSAADGARYLSSRPDAYVP